MRKTNPSKKSRPTEQDIDAALVATGGNKTKAAARLGISIRMLYYRLAAREQNES
ncbi:MULTISPECIES: helix-turn-helix domain-containing protein [unclassified Maridesulfovibrio]|uniref:helix-turn-helix domain-containing protein n=1 Tax=unclassified Maridesulfovibrio TaxID=2794999 RepID=UPI003B3EFA2F